MSDNNKQSIGFISKVYDRNEADSVLDRSFNTFGQTEVTASEKSVDQFFTDYEDLFYQIPIEGAAGSHEYLIRKSSELYHLQDSFEDVQPLLDEITLLRRQSVADQQTIIGLRTILAREGIPEVSIEELLNELKAEDESDQ